MKEFVLKLIAGGIEVGVLFSALFLWKWAMMAKGGLGRLAGRFNEKTKGLTNKADEFARNTKFSQDRQMAKDFRQQEKKRAAAEHFAGKISAEGSSGDRWRRRAAGGMRGMINPNYNKEGQARAGTRGLRQVDQMEQEEVKDASFILESQNILRPDQLRAVANRESVTGANGQTINSAQNPALQRAAIQKIIQAQDAEQLELLYGDTAAGANVDRQMLANEVAKAYSTAKGAGAHIVKLKPVANTETDLETAAVTNLASLASAKLADQDGPAVTRAMQGFMNNRGDAVDRTALFQAAVLARQDATAWQKAKRETRASIEKIINEGKNRSLPMPPPPP